MKIKKTIVTTLAVAMTFALLPNLSTSSAKADALNASDACFIDFVSADIGDSELVYESAPLYDENLEVNGYEYTFTAGDKSGFALVHEVYVAGQVYYEVEEMAYDGQSPFSACEGLPVYVTFCLYLDYVNGSFYDLATNTPISADSLTEATEQGFGYNGGVNFVEDSYTISYATKSTTSYSFINDLPNYYGASAETSCANTAGGIIVAYYDRFNENLIPDFQVYYSIGNTFMYKLGGTGISNLILDLYDRMGTTDAGTTFSGFQAGMASYAQSKGFTYTSTDLFSNGVFNFNNYKNAIDSGKPVAFFLNGYAIEVSRSEANGVDTVTSDVSVNTHVAAACGYKCDTYYDANNNVISTQRYFKISSGLSSYNICYLNMNAYGTINRAISIHIG